MAARILPQLASWPNTAAFVSDDVTIDLASVLASSLVLALQTVASIRAVQPSPSPAIIFASSVHTYPRALLNVSYDSFLLSIILFSALPLARTIAVSFVDVSPSTEIMLNESSITSLKAVVRSFFLISTSVVTKQSIVAMLG